MIEILKIIQKLLPKNEKIKSFFLTIFTAITSISEGLIIGLFYLFFKLINNQDAIQNNLFLRYIYNIVGSPSNESFIVIYLGIICILFIFKNTAIIIRDFFWANFRSKFILKLTNYINSKFINQPYLFHIRFGESKFRQYKEAAFVLVTYAINNLISILTELIVITSVLIVLILIDFQSTLIIGILFIISMLTIYKFIKNKTSKIGNTINESFYKINKITYNAIGGIKEFKVLNKEDYLVNQFYKLEKNYYFANEKNIFYSGIPKTIVETLTIFIFTIAVFYVIGIGQSNQLIPILGSFAIAGFRLYPSFSMITSNYNYIINNAKIILSLNELLNINSINKDIQKQEAKLKIINNLVISDLKFSYDNQNKNDLEIDNIKIKIGSTVGIIGKSGSGKTTFLDIILGLLPINQGSIKIDGRSIYANLNYWQSNIGYVPQSIFLTNTSIKSNIALGIDEDKINIKNVEQALKKSQLYDFVKTLPNGYETVIGERGIRLSGGQKQRIGIARSLYNNPKILCLDEATSSLDQVIEKEVMKSIYKLYGKLTIIIISHRLSTIKNCDSIFVFDEGKLVNKGLYNKVVTDIE